MIAANHGAELGKLNAFFNPTYLWATRGQRNNQTNPVSWVLDVDNWPLFGETPTTSAGLPTAQAENRVIAESLFVTAPVHTAAPTINGTAQVDETLTADPGT